ncbi:MAG: SH3 domain-containing protein [Thermodesulfobacteriota bacterium]
MIRAQEKSRRSSLLRPTVLFAALVLVFLSSVRPAPAAERMAVNVHEANVRAEPGTDKPTLWKLEKYYPVLVTEKKDGWVRVRDFEGDEGWIYAKLLKKMATVVVSVDRAVIRSGPGKTYRIVIRAERGVPFLVLKRQGHWIQVRHEAGHKGWIHDTLVW